MRQLPGLRRFTFCLLLVCAVLAGWFLRGIQLLPDSSSVRAMNSPDSVDVSTISSNVGNAQSKAKHGLILDGNIPKRRSLYQLTAGLRPGRGDPIPDAADVHELPVVDVSFYNWRGELLSGWLSITVPGAPVIILTHGTPGNRLSMVQRAASLHNHGYNVLLFDFQSYGRSQGVISTLGMVESEDILAAISYIHGLPETMYSKIGVLGLSMGATAAVLAASRSQDILALVAESCPVDATRVPGDVPNEEARLADQELVEEIYGVDITQARPIDVVNKLGGHTAVFFINGDADTTTPLPGMQSLYQNAGDPKQYWVVPGANHAQSFAIDPDGYIQHVKAFFDTYLH